jgi:hypothetical protein
MSLARYTYAPHATRGFVPNDAGTADLVVTIPGAPGQASGALDMLTAADVTGLPAAQVIRTWPRDGSRGVEPNYLALVEFDSPDVPWLFSRPVQNGRIEPWIALLVVDVTGIPPADFPLQRTDAGPRLTVDADELPDPGDAWLWGHVQFLGDDAVPADPARSLARLVSPRRLEPDREWLACVVPVLESARRSGIGDTDGANAIRTSRQYAWSTGGGPVVLPVYHSFRFSTGVKGDFEALVRRLDGIPMPEGMGRRRLRLAHPLSGLPAPQPDDPNPDDPRGDFVMHAALRPPEEQDAPIGPLVGADYLSTLLSRLADAGYDLSLVTGPDAPPPRVGPPIYGRAAAGPDGSAAAVEGGTAPPWVEELNVDPRLRVAAGLGALVVRKDQEHYAESAWRQVGDVLAANRLRRRAELSLAASLRLYTKWIEPLDAGALLTSAAPVLPKVAVSASQTVRGALAASSVTAAAVSVELRRQSRSRGAFAKPAWGGGVSPAAVAARSAVARPFTTAVPLDGIEVTAPPTAIWRGERLTGILQALVPALDVAGVTPSDAGAKLDALAGAKGFVLPDEAAVASALASPSLDVDALAASFGLLPARIVRDAVAPPAPPTPPTPPPSHGGPGHHGVPDLHAHHIPLPHSGPAHPVSPAGTPAVVSSHLERAIPVLSRAHGLEATAIVDALRDNTSIVRTVGGRITIDVAALRDLTAIGPAATTLDVRSFDELVAGTFTTAQPVVESLGLDAAAKTAARAELVTSLRDLTDRVVRAVGDATGPPALSGGLDALYGTVLAALDPRTTLPAAVNSQIAALPGALATSFADIMPAPELSEPTYDNLAAISHDWLLPGLDQLPPDTATLAASNRSFISAFLVGVNHELARELLWREYPTDQRATYARQFWSHRLTLDRTDRYDLKHELHRAAALSLTGLQTISADPGEDPLVLVIKGELVRRYPSVIVQAGHTTLDNGARHMADPPIDPDFRGLLEPDVLLLGFTGLTLEKVLEAKDRPNDAYWFFFSEHVSEPRFGFDEADGAAWAGSTWNDATWDGASLDRGRFLTATSFATTLPKGLGGGASFAWGADAATQAWITLQFPFRRGTPATKLLVPKDQP